MASRRWIDGDILAKVGGGAAMVAVPAACWFFGGFITMRLWLMGIFGILLFVWGLLSIGDTKSDWE